MRWWLSAGLVFVLGGCTTDVCQSDSKVATPYADGTTNSARTFYQTTEWEDAWLTFPSGMRYSLQHGLAARPVDMNIWLSLDDHPGSSADKPATPAAGNQALVYAVTDTSIVLSNDTCADVFVRVTAWTEGVFDAPASGAAGPFADGSAPLSDAPLGDAGGTDAGGTDPGGRDAAIDGGL